MRPYILNKVGFVEKKKKDTPKQSWFLHNVMSFVYFTKGINDTDWCFLQVKVNVFGYSQRFVLPILSPGAQTNVISIYSN